jgi:hypothetical protein
MEIYRTIIHEREVDQDIATAQRQYRLVDGTVAGVEWYLCRNPKEGVHRRGEFWVYTQEGSKIHRVPEVTVLYTFTDDEVIFHAILFRQGA